WGMAPIELRLKARAAELGFSLSGIAPATDADSFPHFKDWLACGYAGEMTYLHKLSDERRHPASLQDRVPNGLMSGGEYSPGARKTETGDPASALTPDSRLPTPARVAAYAAGPDYHRFIWDRINALAAWLEAEVLGCRTEAVADTAPLLERDFAR